MLQGEKNVIRVSTTCTANVINNLLNIINFIWNGHTFTASSQQTLSLILQVYPFKKMFCVIHRNNIKTINN